MYHSVQERREKWATKLRTTLEDGVTLKHSQTTGSLMEMPKSRQTSIHSPAIPIDPTDIEGCCFCCLGIACLLEMELRPKDDPPLTTHNYCRSYIRNEEMLERYGLLSKSKESMHKNYPSIVSLSLMNDDAKLTFPQIALLLEWADHYRYILTE